MKKREEIDLRALSQEIFESINIDGAYNLILEGEPVTIEDYRVAYEMLLANLIGNALKHQDKERGFDLGCVCTARQ